MGKLTFYVITPSVIVMFLWQASCEEVMKAIDADGDGEVTREEFVQNAMKSPFIASLLK